MAFFGELFINLFINRLLKAHGSWPRGGRPRLGEWNNAINWPTNCISRKCHELIIYRIIALIARRINNVIKTNASIYQPFSQTPSLRICSCAPALWRPRCGIFQLCTKPVRHCGSTDSTSGPASGADGMSLHPPFSSPFLDSSVGFCG